MVSSVHELDVLGVKRTSTGDGLAVALVLDITAGKDARYTSVAGAGLGDDVAILVEVDLALDQGVGGVVADGVEETVGVDDLLVAIDGVLDTEVGHEAVGLVLADNLGSNGVEANSALGVGEQTISHDLGGTQLVAADKDGDAAAVLGQKHGFLGGRVTTANYVQGLVAEDRHSTVADSAGTDTVLPVGLLAGEVETAGIGAGSNDDSVGGAGRLVIGAVVPLSPHLEGALREVQLGDRLGDDLGTKALRLLAHVLHQLGAADAVREAREVLNIGGGGELTASSGAVGEHALIQDGAEFCTRQVDGGSVGGGARSDN